MPLKNLASYLFAIMFITGRLIANEKIPGQSSHYKDTMPNVFAPHHADFIAAKLKNEAYVRFAQHTPPRTKDEWMKSATRIREAVIQKQGIMINHSLPLEIKETGVVKGNGFTIRKITFQTRPGLFATANLYVPEGKGPFPAVINMNGHWREAKMAESVHSVAMSLVTNGYVCLSIDAFGGGERGTVHGEYEYHGNNLGASMMNLGESLLGFQVSDNIRGVDLLTSLSYVDKQKIGATGASGGGNQTMWVTAIDERIKAAVPVVSVGTFEVYAMHSNCICELPVDALTFTEESGIIGLAAPRAIKMCNHSKDDIPTFLPVQMKRTYSNAKTIYELYNEGKNISYQLSDTNHGYYQADREAMIGWFNLHLKGLGDGSPVKEKPFTTFTEEQLSVFPKGQRDKNVKTIAEYCVNAGTALRETFLATDKFDVAAARQQLKDILRVDENTAVVDVIQHADAGVWKRFTLRTNDGNLVPLIVQPAQNKNSSYVLIMDPGGKSAISEKRIDNHLKNGSGIIIADLWGTGEATSAVADSLDDGTGFHTLSRTELLLGRSVMGEWAKEIDLIVRFVSDKFKPKQIILDGTRETALSAIFYSALYPGAEYIIARDAPVSYLFDNRYAVDFYNMSVHLPGFLKWGDLSLAAAIGGKNILFINPRTMSGIPVIYAKLTACEDEYRKIRQACHQPGNTVFK
ncbi:MAG: acetylxylan esterase [Chitinophagaceae bacterium]|nr:acetylxylan esterase [Chitinophagaceae bacterium]